MRTDVPDPLGSPFSRARARIARARRWVDDRGSGTRLAFAAACVAVAAAIYAVATPTDSVAWEPLYEGRAFPRDDVSRIKGALATGRIPCIADAQGRISVAGDQLPEALALLEKRRLGPRDARTIRNDLDQSSIFTASSLQREQRQLRSIEETSEVLIQELPGIDSATVRIQRERVGRGIMPTWNTKALVYLKIKGARKVSAKVVKSIQTILTAQPGLQPDGITVIDASGHAYLVSGNPDLEVRSMARAREEELEDRIRDRLNWIEGIRVTVSLDTPPVPAKAELPPLPAPAIMVNTPMTGSAEGLPTPEAAPGTVGKAMILVQVPIGYFKQLYWETRQGQAGEPSPDDLMPYVDKTETMIRLTVEHLVPASERGGIKVELINAGGAVRPAPIVAADPQARRDRSWWVTWAAVVGVVALTIGILTGRRLTGRRSADRPARRPGRVRRDDGGDDPSRGGPGPSERVRELVRRDPEAAVGALQRWIGGGGLP